MAITRRQFLGGTLVAAAGSSLGSNLAIGAEAPPVSKDPLNVACIGMGGQMQGHFKGMVQAFKQRLVAVCDVDERRCQDSLKSIGDAAAGIKVYRDYRKLLDSEKSLDAVIIATPDHWHAPICKAAIQAGKHVYCEKPLTHSVAEARELREMSKRSKVVTQTGNQGSASTALRRSIELIQAGLLGQVREVHVWHPTHGWPCGVNRPAGEDPVPQGLDWNFWIGPAPMRPYKSAIYHPFQWRGWYDFGGGSLADFCCHGFNLPVRALKLNYATKIEVSGKNMDKESFPTSCTVRYHFPQREGLLPVMLGFYTGGDMPPVEATQDMPATWGKVPALGCVILGDKGSISAGLWNNDCTLKLKQDAKFRGVLNHEAAKTVPQTLPRSDNHMKEWVDACKGGPGTFSDFEIGGHITEIGLAGLIALRLGREIEWDGLTMQVKGVPEAAALVRPQYRQGWRV